MSEEQQKTILTETVSVDEALARLQISYVTLGRWIKQGRLRAIRYPGNTKRIYKTEIDKILQEGL